MRLLHYFIFLSLLFLSNQSLSQCSPLTGAPPLSNTFNTGRNGLGGALPGSSADLKWKIAKDSITGTYSPCIVMSTLPSIFYRSPWSDCKWISFSPTGEHTGDRYFFFRIDFDLPCYNFCGKSYNDDNAFCLNLDLFADNSIFEIYINNVPQSGNLGNIIPFPNPFNPPGHTQSDKTSVSLCKNWKAGNNTLIIQVASSATVAGMLAQASLDPPPPPDADTVAATICQGTVFRFGNRDLTQPGYYFQSFPRNSGCDSNVVLNLNVKQKSDTTITQTICEGQTYAGHGRSGTYVDTYAAANGCDSIRTLNLIVQEKPKFNLGTRTAICEGDSIILLPGPFFSYAWQDGSTGDHFVVKKPGLYNVTVTNSCGTTTKEINIKNGICNINFPNTFTPNNDRKNDFFKILTDLRIQEYSLSVFNRWGQKVFETNDPATGWNGISNGKDQPSGVYGWTCTYKISNITSRRKGTLLLLR